MLITAICLLVAALILVGFFVYRHKKQVHEINRAQLTEIVRSNNCNKGLAQTSQEQASNTDVSGSIALLSYRGYCFAQVGNYKEAVIILEQLKEYYKMQGNTSAVLGTESDIANFQRLEAKAAVQQVGTNKQ